MFMFALICRTLNISLGVSFWSLFIQKNQDFKLELSYTLVTKNWQIIIFLSA